MKYFFSSRLTERATWRGGKRLQTSGGERAGRSGWYFTLFSSFLGIHQQSMCIQRSSCLSFIIRSSWRAFTYCQNQRRIPHLSSIKQSSQGGLLWRLAWYLRFFLPNYYAEHTHGKYSSEKSNQEAFMTGRYIFQTAEKAQL